MWGEGLGANSVGQDVTETGVFGVSKCFYTHGDSVLGKGQPLLSVSC